MKTMTMPRDLERKDAGDADDEIKALITELGTESKKALDGLKADLKAAKNDAAEAKERAEKLELRMQRPTFGGADMVTSADREAKQAFSNYLRLGGDGLTPDERKTLTLSPDPAGGYLAPTQFQAELLKDLVAFSGVRQVARVMSMSASSIVLPRRTGTLTGGWVGEISDRPSTGQTFGQLEFIAREMACYVDVSNQLLDDSAIDISAEISADLAEEFGRLEGAAFVNGTSPLQPEGFMTSPPAIETINSGHATLITADSLITVLFDLPAQYRRNAVWGMNSTTLAHVRKLKDGAGNYLTATNDLSGAPAATLLGRPIIEMPDMPDQGAGLKPIVVGDFNQGYRIFDRIGLQILRDPYSQATNGITRFHARRRVAGGVGKSEALRTLTCSAS